ncbi:MAG: hypothetical protein VX962_02900, partial [Pseudomonadota bacterium]|nr:hypothetical protein [Pseudomonadota bacterium]
EAAFPIYKNDVLGHLMIISGIGQNNAAGATSYICGRYDVPAWAAWINIGIAGYAEGPLGKLFQVGKVTNELETRVAYPGFRLPKLVPLTTLETREQPCDEYKADTLYDMEGLAFTETASRFSCNELTFLFKVVSDSNAKQLRRINPLYVEKLLAQNINTILLLVDAVKELVEDEKKRLKISQDVEVVLNKFHFTVSRKAQLIQKYRRWKTAFPNAPFGEVYENAKSAGDVIDTMEKILSSAVFGRPNS